MVFDQCLIGYNNTPILVAIVRLGGQTILTRLLLVNIYEVMPQIPQNATSRGIGIAGPHHCRCKIRRTYSKARESRDSNLKIPNPRTYTKPMPFILSTYPCTLLPSLPL